MKDCYSVTSHSVKAILGFIDSCYYAIPEIQRPFVWDKTQVRDFIDSLYHGYPTGYLITWKNPDVRIKDGGTSVGKTVLIDGQQRVTALTAAIAGREVLNDDYESQRVKISFNPMMEGDGSPFSVQDASTLRNKAWIPDISALFVPNFNHYSFISDYVRANTGSDPNYIGNKITDLLGIATRQIGVIDISPDCTIDEVGVSD